ncbi:MAG: efflux RND transporter periplasmic adaptor subunit, partial [Luteimonas sp.]|nr:efflux RND transporter periplasmic adaptor subunit [Luteimonas sp.]
GGRVTVIGFESGALAKAGDVLLQLDTAGEDAQLASAKATAAEAGADVTRARALWKRNAVSRQELESAEARFKEAAARVDTIRALIAKKTIRAPFSGRLGLRLVNLGQILNVGDAIVSLQTLDPINVDFSITQQQVRHLNPGMRVRVTSDAVPGKIFEGEITAINPEVDPATRTVRVRARVANPEETLYAGMFAHVEVVLPETRSVLPIPATAVLYAPYGDSVFVVEQRKNEQGGATELALRQQFVRLGQARGDFVDVADGLKAGERVVTSGVFKLRTGTAVVIDNTLTPRAELEPHPTER